MPPIDATDTMGLSSGAVVGILLGCVLGYMCYVNRRFVVWGEGHGGDRDGDGDGRVYRDRRFGGEGQGRIWKSVERVGGGEHWGMRSGYGDGVGRPDQAVVREGRRGRGGGEDERLKRIRREWGRKWNDDYNYDYQGVNENRRWERKGNRRVRKRRSGNTWIVIERRGIFDWGKLVESSNSGVRGRERGRSSRRGTSTDNGEFGSPVRSWRGLRRDGDA